MKLLFIPSSSKSTPSSALGSYHSVYSEPLFILPKLCLSSFFIFLYFTLRFLFIDSPHSILFWIYWIFDLRFYFSYLNCWILWSFSSNNLLSAVIFSVFILVLSEFSKISSPYCYLTNVSKPFWYKATDLRNYLFINASKNNWSHFSQNFITKPFFIERLRVKQFLQTTFLQMLQLNPFPLIY